MNKFRALILLFLSVTIFNSCGRRDAYEERAGFHKYLDGIKERELPIALWPLQIYKSGLPELANDSVIKRDMYPLCKFKLSDNIYGVITVGTNNCPLPILTTYTKNGKVIEEKLITFAGCGYKHRSIYKKYTVINTDFSMFLTDTFWTHENYDSEKDIIKEYCISRRGSIDPLSGKIKLSEETKTLRNARFKYPNDSY